MFRPGQTDLLGKACMGVAVWVFGAFCYFIDCTLVSSHGTHHNVGFFRAGIYEDGPMGFVASAFLLICGLGQAIYYGLRYTFRGQP